MWKDSNSFKKLAMLLLGTLNFQSYETNLFTSCLVPPVMSYCTFPAGALEDKVTWVFNPDGVIGGGTCARLDESHNTDM